MRACAQARTAKSFARAARAPAKIGRDTGIEPQARGGLGPGARVGERDGRKGSRDNAMLPRSSRAWRYSGRSQFSMVNPGTRRKCLTLSVTHAMPMVIACAAIRGSMRPICCPVWRRYRWITNAWRAAAASNATTRINLRYASKATRFTRRSRAPEIPVQISTAVSAEIAKEPRGAEAIRFRIFS